MKKVDPNSPTVFKISQSQLKAKARADSSCMSINSPSVMDSVNGAQFNQLEDKIMRDIIESYKNIMNSQEKSNMENLFLKKLRLHHPWFRLMTFASFKMVFDLSQLVSVRWGEKLFK